MISKTAHAAVWKGEAAQINLNERFQFVECDLNVCQENLINLDTFSINLLEKQVSIN
jgi:hypothetical protein